MANITGLPPVDVQSFMHPQYVIMGSLVLFGIIGYFFIGFLSKERPVVEHKILHILLGLSIGAAAFFVLFSPIAFKSTYPVLTGAATFSQYFIENCNPEYPVVQGMAFLGFKEAKNSAVPEQCDMVTPVNYLSGFFLLMGVLILLLSLIMFLRHNRT